MTTIQDVKEILLSKKNNLIAHRWAKDENVMQYLLESHISWNEDHIKMNYPDMVYTLQESIDYHLDTPWIIDKKLTPPELQ